MTTTPPLAASLPVLLICAWTMAEFQGRLFWGTLPSGRVLSIEAGRNVAYDRPLAPGWHHLPALPEGDRLKLWLDGKLVATSTKSDPDAYAPAVAQPVKISLGPNDYFRGSLRDLRICDYALSGREFLPAEPVTRQNTQAPI